MSNSRYAGLALLGWCVLVGFESAGAGFRECVTLTHTPDAKCVRATGTRLYVGDQNGRLYVYDTTAPLAPVLLGSINLGYDIRDIAISGDVAYLATGYGLQLRDVSNPGGVVWPLGQYAQVGATAIALGASHAFVTDGYGRLVAYDVSNTTIPTPVGTNNIVGIGWDIALAGSYAYVAADQLGGFRIVDVSTPSAMVTRGTVGCTAFSVVKWGDYIYVGTYTNGVHVMNVANPWAPSVLATFWTANNCRLAAKGHLYALGRCNIQHYGGSITHMLQAVNITDPSHAACIATAPAATNFNGNGIAVWLDSLYVACRSEGVKVFEYVGATPNDFDGDAKSDIGVYHIGGTWYFNRSSAGFLKDWFGFLGATKFTDDFDADGQTDYGVYFPNTGYWYFMCSQQGFSSRQFGYGGTLPLTGDFDGDGRADIGVMDPGTAQAYLMRSSDGFLHRSVNHVNGVPVSGDFDGDGCCDYGTYVASSGSWYVRKQWPDAWSFGYAGTLPVVADFDGDGRDDYGVYDPNSGTWYVMRSKAGFWTKQFGFAGTRPVTGDYDGDGRLDYGVYHDGSGTWYIMQSRDGFRTEQFGYPGTTPVD